MSRFKTPPPFWLCLFFMALMPCSLAASSNIKLVVASTPFVLPAKISMLQKIAQQHGISLQGHVVSPTQAPNSTWFDDVDLVILDTPRGGGSRQMMEPIKPLLSQTPWIAPRGGRPDGGNLAPQLLQTLTAYYQAGGVDNFNNMMAFIRAWKLGESTAGITPPLRLPSSGYYHPKAKKPFEKLADYLAWGKNRWPKKAPVLAIAMSTGSISDGQTALYDYLIEQLENSGITPLVFWYERLNKNGLTETIAAAKPVMLLNTTHMVSGARKQEFKTLNIPVIIGLNHRGGDIEQWRDAVQGATGGAYSTLMVIPEGWGMSDPIILSAVVDGAPAAIPEQVDLLIGRFKAMAKLQQSPPKEVNLALLFWNSPAGEKNLSASNLNVPRSIENILSELAKQGYHVTEKDETHIIRTAQSLLAAYYRPETLDDLLKNGNAQALPLQKYQRWLQALPAKIQEQMQQAWGDAENHSNIRTVNGEKSFIIPRAKLGNLVLLPQPPRADNLGESTHDKVQPPGHFYLAAYLYLREHFKADALIHLGTHGSQEWTPGKDRGLWAYDYPNLAVGNVPVFYPYIQDNIGEAMQAKRRGRATIISHQTPPFAPSGFYDELTDIHDLMHQYMLLENGAVRDATLSQMMDLVVASDLHQDIGWTEDKLKQQADAFIPVLHDHLHLLAQATTPIGLHTFGEPAGDDYRIATVMQQLGGDYYQALGLDAKEMFAASFEELFKTPAYTYLLPFLQAELDPKQAKNQALQTLMQQAIKNDRRLRNDNELEALITGLRGQFVLPGGGGDPVRNPNTSSGTNLFALDPEKIPSPAAYKAAEKTFNQLVTDYRDNHAGEAPDKLAFSLWSSETIRTLGLSEAQVMWAIGVRPIWNSGGKVTSLEVIPQAELGRPRIDVLLQATSVYRDQFDGIMRKLARVIEELAELDEANNPIAENSRKLALSLQEKGLAATLAKRYSRARIFSNQPGDYGSGVTSVAMDSTSWEDDSILADTFINTQSHIYGSDNWGTAVHELKLLETQLQGVDAVLLSRSSNLHGLLSTDHPYEYLGGLSASVKKVSGKNPDLYISNARSSQATIVSAKGFLSNELRSRYQNPQWIKGMQKEGYAGTVAILKVVNNLFGWQAVDSNMVRSDQWQSMHETYVMDKRQLGINEWFAEHNATAQVQLIERMVEAIRKGYWDASDQTRQELIARWQTLVNDLDGQAGAEKTVEFIQSQAAGFGMGSLAANAAQNSESNANAEVQNVRGQELEEVQQDNQEQDLPWLMWLASLLLLGFVLAGMVITSLQQRKLSNI